MKRNYVVLPALVIIVLVGSIFIITNSMEKRKEVSSCVEQEGYYWDSQLEMCKKLEVISDETAKIASEIAIENISKEYNSDNVKVVNYSDGECEDCFIFEMNVKDKKIFVFVIREKINNIYEEPSVRTYCQSPRPEACTAEYSPVCGIFEESISCVSPPCGITYSNGCEACSDNMVEYWVEGEC